MKREKRIDNVEKKLPGKGQREGGPGPNFVPNPASEDTIASAKPICGSALIESHAGFASSFLLAMTASQ